MKYKMMLSKTKAKLEWILRRPEYTYLCLALFSLLGFVFLTPPFQGPDEELHYVKVQYLAHGYLIPSGVAKVPKSINDVTKTTFYNDDIRGKTNQTYELGRTKAALRIPLNEKSTYKPVMITYNLLLYLPAVPGVIVANLLNLSPLISMYIARLSLGVASILLFFLAIKLIPHKKYLLLAVGLIPTILFQQSVITADSLSYALLALFIAYVLYLRSKEEISKKQWVYVGLLCVAIAIAKPLVFLFLPLVFLLVKKKYAWRWILGIFIICGLGYLGWNVANASQAGHADVVATAPSTVDSSKQLQLLVSEPLRGLRVGWNSYMTSYGDDEVRGVIGVFGAADTIYPLWMVLSYVSVLAIAAFVSFDPKVLKKINWRWKLISLVLCIAYFAAVNLALYLGYTPVNFDIVYGVQGRYFVPIIIIFATIILTGGVHLSKFDAYRTRNGLIIAITILILLALFITLQRYYLYTP